MSDVDDAVSAGSVSGEEDDGLIKLPDNELGFRPLKLPKEAAMFFGDLELDEELATMEILAGEGDAVEAIRCHAAVLALRSTEIMQELLLCEDPPTPDDPLVLEFPDDDQSHWEKAVHWAYTNEIEYELEQANDLRRFAEDRGFKALAKLLQQQISDSIRSDPRKAFTIAAQALEEEDTAMVKLAFDAAYHVPDAIDSAAVRALPPHGFEMFIADDRATGSELLAFRAAVEWAETLMRALEKAGKQFFDRLRHSDDLDIEDDEEEEEEEDGAGGKKDKDEDDAKGDGGRGLGRALPWRRSSRTGPLRKAKTKPKPSASSSSSSSSSSLFGLAPGHHSAGVRLTARPARLRAKPEPPTELGGFSVRGLKLKPIRQVFAGKAIREAMGKRILDQIRFPLMHPAELALVVAPTGLLTEDELAELLCYATRRVILEEQEAAAAVARRTREREERAATEIAPVTATTSVPGILGMAREITGESIGMVGGLFDGGSDSTSEGSSTMTPDDAPVLSAHRVRGRRRSAGRVSIPTSSSGSSSDGSNTPSSLESPMSGESLHASSLESDTPVEGNPRAAATGNVTGEDEEERVVVSAAAGGGGGDGFDDMDHDEDDGLTPAERKQLALLVPPGSGDPKPHMGKKSLWEKLKKRGQRRLERLERLGTVTGQDQGRASTDGEGGRRGRGDKEDEEDGYEGDEGGELDDEDDGRWDDEDLDGDEEDGSRSRSRSRSRGRGASDEHPDGLGVVEPSGRSRRREAAEAAADRRPRVCGYLAAPRHPLVVPLEIFLWGGGGASGKFGTGGLGGAGGYLHVQFMVKPGQTLEVHVGEGGEAGGDSGPTRMAYPNGGRGGWDYRAGGGGGATYVSSDAVGGEVVAGAGGGGGGTAGNSWAAGGGGGGGTRDGKVGSKGDGQKSQSMTEVEGADGNGNGGKHNSSGSCVPGENNHGAGGRPGTSGSRADGGSGGFASYKHATLVSQTNASSHTPVRCPSTGAAHGAGAERPNCTKGKSGACIIINPATGQRLELVHDATASVKAWKVEMQTGGTLAESALTASP